MLTISGGRAMTTSMCLGTCTRTEHVTRHLRHVLWLLLPLLLSHASCCPWPCLSKGADGGFIQVLVMLASPVSLEKGGEGIVSCLLRIRDGFIQLCTHLKFSIISSQGPPWAPLGGWGVNDC